jgi:hypothetical protein
VIKGKEKTPCVLYLWHNRDKTAHVIFVVYSLRNAPFVLRGKHSRSATPLARGAHSSQAGCHDSQACPPLYPYIKKINKNFTFLTHVNASEPPRPQSANTARKATFLSYLFSPCVSGRRLPILPDG